MSNRMRFLTLASLLAVAAAAQAQTPLTIPNGLPSWAFNIPDKVQPPRAEATGPIRVPGSSKELDAAAVASNATPPDWFPDEHPPAPRIVKGEAGVDTAGLRRVPSHVGTGASRIRRHRRPPRRVFHPSDEVFQERSPQRRDAHGPDCQSHVR